MACDICGKPESSPQRISSDYETDDIKTACSDCISMLNDQLWKIRAMHRKAEKRLTKSWMASMRERFFNK